MFGGKPYSRGGLYKLLNNEVYTGRIGHWGQSYAGQHPAIIETETWEKVKALLAANDRGRRQRGRNATSSVLAGLVFDTGGNRYTPTHAVKNGRRYRYYTSQAIIQKRRTPSPLDRIPAKELEHLVCSRIETLLASPQELAAAYTESTLLANDGGILVEAAQELAVRWSKFSPEESAEFLRHVVCRIVLRGSEVEIEVYVEALAARLLQDGYDGSAIESREAPTGKHLLTLRSPFTLARPHGELRLVLPGSDIGGGKSSSSLLKAIVTAHRWRERIIAGEVYSRNQLASEAKLNLSYAGRILRLAALSPAIVDGVVHHRLAADRSLRHFLTGLPLEWNHQQSWLMPA